MHPLDLSPKANRSLLKSYSGESKRKINNLSFDSTVNNRDTTMCNFGNKREKDPGKRGRPRADILTTLMVEGTSSRSKIRCNKCGRVFPREKSLQAHLRTHTGERPYTCDFPGCTKAFCQSGQLKTHQRLHTGEKPFVCNVEGCGSRFTHANRHCSSHPNAGLKRTEMNMLLAGQKFSQDAKKSPEKEWLERYIRRCKDRQNSREPGKKDEPYSSGPLDMTKRVMGSRSLSKRRGSTSSTNSVSSTETTTSSISPPRPSSKDNNSSMTRKKTNATSLPPIPPFSPVSVSASPVRFSSTSPYPLSPPLAHQSSVTLTPLTPCHPGLAASVNSISSSSLSPLSSPSSLSSYSSSSSVSSYSSSSASSTSPTSTAVRDLSFKKQTPPKPVPYRYLTKAMSTPVVEKKQFDYVNVTEPSSKYYSYSSPIVLNHTSCSVPYFGQVISTATLHQPMNPSKSPSQTPSRDFSINPPIKNEKDRYLSALALIELSKG